MYTFSFIVLVLGVFLIGVLFLLYIMYRKLAALQKPQDGNLFVMLQNQIQELARSNQDLSKMVDQKVSDTHKVVMDNQQHLHQTIQNQFSQSAKIITDVTERLTKLDETNRQVVGVAEQLQGLENVLKNPKHRGVLGEYYLENVL